MNKFTQLLCSISLIVLLAACEENTITSPKITKGAYVLSEGSFFSGVASRLSRYDVSTGTVSGDYFSAQNAGASLGMNANDIQLYGSKLYVVVNASNQLLVLQASNGSLIKRIDFTNAATGTDPRYAAAANGNLYVSCSNNKVAIVDTATLSITGSIGVGSNPEQMAVSGNKLYVVNSGGFNYPNFDSTLSIINLATHTQEAKIRVGLNPNYIVADGNALYIGYFGNYGNIKPGIVRINTSTQAVTHRIDSAAGRMALHQSNLYVATGYAGGNKVIKFNKDNLSVLNANFAAAGNLSSPYGIGINPQTGDVWITDAVDFSSTGKVAVFEQGGGFKFGFSVAPGVNPNSVAFVAE